MLRLALTGELAAVAQFNAAAQECHGFGDHGTAAVFEEMVRDEKHVDWFEASSTPSCRSASQLPRAADGPPPPGRSGAAAEAVAAASTVPGPTPWARPPSAQPHHPQHRHERRREMTTWTSEELTRIGNAEELRVSSLRADGTLRPYVTIWVVGSGQDPSSAPPTDPTTRGSAAPGPAERAGSAPAAWSVTSPSSGPTATSTPRSTRPTTQSTTVTRTGHRRHRLRAWRLLRPPSASCHGAPDQLDHLRAPERPADTAGRICCVKARVLVATGTFLAQPCWVGRRELRLAPQVRRLRGG